MLELVLAAGQSETTTSGAPPIVYAAVAALAFAFLGFVVWSFRDVANRHSHKTSKSAGHGTDHH